MTSPALAAADLRVAYLTAGVTTEAVGSIDLDLDQGAILGLAGESGSGKSTLALTLMGYRVPGARILSGSVRTRDGADLLSSSRAELSNGWGKRLAYVPQNAATALNPARRIGAQMAEAIRAHLPISRREARERSLSLLDQVALSACTATLRKYPHQFSGGQQQRIALAIALACEPEILILDEPTTGLDVTTQAQINELITELVGAFGSSAIYVSHDLSLLATICDEIAIMYAGEIVERASASDIYFAPRHPYTAALVAAVPKPTLGAPPPRGIPGMPPSRMTRESCSFADRCRYADQRCWRPVSLRTIGEGRQVRCVRSDELSNELQHQHGDAHGSALRSDAQAPTVLEISDLYCGHGRGSAHKLVVKDLSFSVSRSQVVGIAGESGSGKSTLLRAVAGLLAPVSGEISLHGRNLESRVRARRPEARRQIQLVFQNPDASLNPAHSVGEILERPIRLFEPDVNRAERRTRVGELLDRIRFSSKMASRRPRELSGGQRQRVALGRALASRPDVLLCDEVTSALDVSVQATIVELLLDLCRSEQLGLVFVTHDLGILQSIADDVLVMKDGEIRERGSVEEVYGAPTDPYTRTLLASVAQP